MLLGEGGVVCIFPLLLNCTFRGLLFLLSEMKNEKKCLGPAIKKLHRIVLCSFPLSPPPHLSPIPHPSPMIPTPTLPVPADK